MAPSKRDLALAAILAASLIWIEHNHRVVAGPQTAAAAPASAASVCPKTDDAPYSAACIRFIGGGVARAMVTASAVHTEPRCPPGGEGAPDGDSCIGEVSVR